VKEPTAYGEPAPPQEIGRSVEELCEWINLPALSDAHAAAKAVLVHLFLVWIHPFGDGNGRTARLLELRMLLQAGLPAPVAHLLSNHWNASRRAYARQMTRVCRSGEIEWFLLYAAHGLLGQLDGLRLSRGKRPARERGAPSSHLNYGWAERTMGV
jgi:Fic family protein